MESTSNAVTRLPAFADRSRNFRAALSSCARVIRLERGQWLQSEGDLVGSIYIVLEGQFGSYVSVDDRRDVLVGVSGPGSIMGTANAPRLVTAIARSHVDCARFTNEDVAGLGEQAAEVRAAFTAMSTAQTANLVRRYAQKIALPPRRRIAAEILHLHEQFPGGLIQVSQSDLSELTGLSRKTVNLHLGRLRADNLIDVAYGGLRVANLAGLKAFAFRAGAAPRGRTP
jgi:CRP/FNR family transcriptional regulator, cyclic AMP receptor protein